MLKLFTFALITLINFDTLSTQWDHFPAHPLQQHPLQQHPLHHPLQQQQHVYPRQSISGCSQETQHVYPQLPNSGCQQSQQPRSYCSQEGQLCSQHTRCCPPLICQPGPNGHYTCQSPRRQINTTCAQERPQTTRPCCSKEGQQCDDQKRCCPGLECRPADGGESYESYNTCQAPCQQNSQETDHSVSHLFNFEVEPETSVTPKERSRSYSSYSTGSYSSSRGKQKVETENAPAAIGPYSQAIKAGQTVYISGQTGLDRRTGIVPESFEAQAIQTFKNVQAIAKAAGGGLEDIVKLTVFLVNMNDFAKLNEIQAKFFTRQPFPAQSTVVVKSLPKSNLIVEVEAVMYLS